MAGDGTARLELESCCRSFDSVEMAMTSTILGAGRRYDQILSRSSRGREGKGRNVEVILIIRWIVCNEWP
jgi:hypothetical protein